MQHRPIDHEFDPPRGQTAAIATHARTRLIANPFLAILGMVLALSALKLGLRSRDLILFVSAAIGMVISLPMIQYHCLDCGETGWAFRARRHLCPLGTLRGMSADNGRPPFPTILAQLKVWFVIAVAAACYDLLRTLIHR